MNFHARIMMALNSIDQRLDQIEKRLDSGDNELVGIAEACRILRTTRYAIYKRIERGQLQCVQDEGGHYKFNRHYLKSLTSIIN